MPCRLRESGRTLFIATNSGYQYTKRIMAYLLEEGGVSTVAQLFTYV